jgi:hypothetical protein
VHAGNGGLGKDGVSRKRYEFLVRLTHLKVTDGEVGRKSDAPHGLKCSGAQIVSANSREYPTLCKDASTLALDMRLQRRNSTIMEKICDLLLQRHAEMRHKRVLCE